MKACADPRCNSYIVDVLHRSDFECIPEMARIVKRLPAKCATFACLENVDWNIGSSAGAPSQSRLGDTGHPLVPGLITGLGFTPILEIGMRGGCSGHHKDECALFS